MSRYIIDTNIIIMYPSILLAKLKIVIPDIVLEELKMLASRNQTYNTILEIMQSNNSKMNIAKTKIYDDDFETISFDLPRISRNDLLIANLAKEYTISHQGEDVFLVTNDKTLQIYCKRIGVKVLNLNEIKDKIINLWKNEEVQENEEIQENEEVKKKVISLNKAVIGTLILNIIVAIITSLAANIFANYLKDIFEKINIWGTIILVPLFGIILYYLRSKFRLFYGITEFLIGISTSLRVFIPNFDYSSIYTAELFQILGGLYIIVRGMDNIEKGLEHTKYYYYWCNFFGKNA